MGNSPRELLKNRNVLYPNLGSGHWEPSTHNIKIYQAIGLELVQDMHSIPYKNKMPTCDEILKIILTDDS